MNEPLTNECRYQVMPDASLRRNKDADILVLSDVRSAVELLKSKFHPINDGNILKIIDDCFPVFKGEKK